MAINRVITIKIDMEQEAVKAVPESYGIWEDRFIDFLLMKFKEQGVEVFIEAHDEEYGDGKAVG